MDYNAAWWGGTIFADPFGDLDTACVKQAIILAECASGLACVRKNCPKIYPTALAIKVALIYQGLLGPKINPDPKFPAVSGNNTASYVKMNQVKDTKREYFKPEDIRPKDSSGNPIIPSMADMLADIIKKCTPPPMMMGVLGGMTTSCGCGSADANLSKQYGWTVDYGRKLQMSGGWTGKPKPKCDEKALCDGIANEHVKCITNLANRRFKATYGRVDPATAVDGDHYFDADGSFKLEAWNGENKCLEIVAVCTGNVVMYTDVDGIAQTAIYDGVSDEWVVQPPASNLDCAAVLACIIEDPAALTALCEVLAPMLISTSTSARKAKA